jgi:hypothetical protein
MEAYVGYVMVAIGIDGEAVRHQEQILAER